MKFHREKEKIESVVLHSLSTFRKTKLLFESMCWHNFEGYRKSLRAMSVGCVRLTGLWKHGGYQKAFSSGKPFGCLWIWKQHCPILGMETTVTKEAQEWGQILHQSGEVRFSSGFWNLVSYIFRSWRSKRGSIVVRTCMGSTMSYC